MINKILISIAYFILILTSCSRINPKDITVIDGIRLGMDEEIFYSQLDSLNIKQQTFYTKGIFTDLNEVDDYRMNGYITDIFNSSKYSSTFTHTYGIYYPTVMTGTRNIIGLKVLLVHTDNALAITQNGTGNITKKSKIPALSQNLSYNQIDEIANMISTKYGKPSDTLVFELTNFFVIKKNQVKNYHSDSINIGELLIWKTKFLDIEYFKGIESLESTFNSKENTYFTIIDKSYRQIDYENGERPCRSYAYISYQLNEESIKKLELDKTKL